MIVNVVHFPMLAFGFAMGILLLGAIARTTSRAIKNYSVLILWCAINDLLSIAADILSIERITVVLPTLVFFSSGPCAYISHGICNCCNSLFCGTVTQSTIIMAISFWYRLRLLSKPPPSVRAINVIVFTTALPNVAHLIFFNNVKEQADPALLKTVQWVHSQENLTGVAIYGLTDIYKPYQAVAYGYFFVVMPLLFLYLIVTRNMIVITLQETKANSNKTRALHKVFLKILTIHALLPIGNVLSCMAVFLIILGVYNVELETMIFAVAIVPAVVNPAVTIWFIKSYRRFVLNIFGIKSKPSDEPSNIILRCNNH